MPSSTNTSAASRPDPDALLAQLQADSQRAHRGKLRIYFGSNAGVGKTYAMLAAAQRERQAGRSVLVGLVETHGRAETEQQLHDLELLARRQLVYQGRQLDEFDLDAALARRPEVLLLDELAHSNVSGSRHPKRWQDVQELLEAGIEVWTTLNVQHLESLNDVVGGIVGIQVHETVPDHLFDDADEVIVVDIPPRSCSSASRRARSIRWSRPKGPRAISSARAICWRCASWPCAARQTGSMRTCATIAVSVPSTMSGRRASACWWAWAGAPATMPWCARWHDWREGWRPTGWWSMWMRPSASIGPVRPRKPCSGLWRWPRVWGRKRPPFPAPKWPRPWWTLRVSAMPAIWCWHGCMNL